ncbi:ATPase PAAT isoform X2 [Phalacrocorax aristotelis]|uniref:ATPase PAAT isoform X2 n=1 Tax=Phalacrocorax aristotelis TaxID=126867 RepID=UPI003F4B7DFE
MMANGCAAAAEEEEEAAAAADPCCVAARCSWPCAPPDGLARAVCLRRGAGGGEASTEAVVVERRAGGESEAPCLLHLECWPAGGAEMISVGILSEARNMEVYVGEEYCGTGRGESLGAARAPGNTENVTLYKKYLKFECPAASCKIKNSLPLGDKLTWIFGKNSDFGGDHAIDGSRSAALQTSLDKSASEPLPVQNNLTSETACEDLKISCDLKAEVPERGNADSERLNTQQNTVDLRNYFKIMGVLRMQEQASETPNVANPQVLLPFLQNLCSQVNHLRLKDGDRHFGKKAATKEEGIQCVGVEQQPICSYLEKMISKNMDLMEKKLMDYIDRQIQALQTHIDNKMILLMDLVQNSKPNKISQVHYDSNEGLSNGER